MVKTFDIVVAADLERGIGKNQALPWKLPGDLAYFKKLTSAVTAPGKHNAVIMGRKTWESIPAQFRPLPGRLNIVLTHDSQYAVPEGVLKASNLDQALSATDSPDLESCFIIGGGAVFAECMGHPLLKRLYLTDIHASLACDTFLPAYEGGFELISQSELKCENGLEYCFKVYRKLP